MIDAIVGSILGLLMVLVILLTAPWWIPLVDRPFNAWCEWVDRRIEQRQRQ